jgi:hypothetical protein
MVSQQEKNMNYRVGTFREAGLEARWTKTRAGAPIIVVRNPNSPEPHQRDTWWGVTDSMWKSMQNEGILMGFDNNTVMGDIFSIAL